MNCRVAGCDWAVIAAVLPLLLGCFRPEGLDEEQLARTVAKAERQNPEELILAVADLGEAHRREAGVMYADAPGPHRRIEASGWVFQRFAALGMDPWIEEAEVEGYPISNVVAEIQGRTRPQELVLVSAHHDVWYLGTDDNCSGVVAMLAAARTLRDSGPGRTIRFVSMDQEETGDFYGSRYHYDHLDTGRVRAVINVDTIAYANRSAGSQSSSRESGWPCPSTRATILAV